MANSCNINSAGIVTTDAAGTFSGRTLTQPAAGITISNADGISGDPTFSLSDDLLALENLPGVGFAARTAASTWAQRTLTGTSNQISVSNGNGVSGAPTFSLTSDIHVDGISFNSGTDVLSTFDIGTFTPVLSASTTPPDTVTYTIQRGNYLRINQWVYIEIFLNIATFTLGSGAGETRITGLPFATTTQFQITCNAIGNLNLVAGSMALTARTAEGGSNDELDIIESVDNTSESNLNISSWTAGSRLGIQGFYLITS